MSHTTIVRLTVGTLESLTPTVDLLCLQSDLYPAQAIPLAWRSYEDWKARLMKETKKRLRPKATQASVRGETYKLVSDEAKRRGITITEMMEIILADAFEEEAEETDETTRQLGVDYRNVLF